MVNIQKKNSRRIIALFFVLFIFALTINQNINIIQPELNEKIEDNTNKNIEKP